MDYAVPLISAIVSFAFAVAVLDQYFARRRPYQLVWAIGLLMFCVATATQAFWAAGWAQNETVYRLYYLFGAVLVAAYLGMGTIYLLARRRVANIIMLVLLLLSAYAVYAVFTADIDANEFGALVQEEMPRGVKLLPTAVRSMTPVFNTFGTVALVGGALYSAWVFWRRRILAYRVASNVLIAIGAILLALHGIQIRLGGAVQLVNVLELVAIVLIFVGFLRSREVFGLYRFPLIHGFGRVSRD